MESSITAILTVYKRDNLSAQLTSIYSQTKVPDRIIVYQNETHVDITPYLDSNIEHVHNKNINFKFHGRFTLPLLLDTNYTIILDDDTIIGKDYIRSNIDVSNQLNCIIGSNGRNYNPTYRDFRGGTSLCDGHFNIKPHRCDVVGHSWLFKTKWIHNMWRDEATTFNNGEDLHFCLANKLYGNIDSYVAPSPKDNKDVWGDLKPAFGNDAHATHLTVDHNKLRVSIVEHYISRGYILNKERD